MSPAISTLLPLLIDDYIAWFVAWHKRAMGDLKAPLGPPARFALWREEAIHSLSGEQPAIEHLAVLHEQLHTLVKLVPMKAPVHEPIERKDDDSIAAKYMELMRELRRFERAFAMAASDLDPLTGLRTRRVVMQDLDKEISRAVRAKKPFFVAVMDIDYFKRVNDTYGHESGDRVLAAIANQVSKNLRLHDDAYRMGGEEFLLSLKETDAEGALLVVERLRTAIEKTPVVVTENMVISVTASFGLASSDDMSGADDLLRSADRALYRAKNQGRNRVVAA